MKARRVLQLIVAWLAAIITPIFAGLAILTFVPFLPNYIFHTTASNEFMVGIINGIREVCKSIPLEFISLRPYLFGCIVFILPTFLMWLASLILFSANRGKQGKYNFALILVLIATLLSCGVVGGFSKVLLGDNMMLGIYCAAGVAFVFILFTLLALLVKGKAQCVCSLCECSECAANEDYAACQDCPACEVCDVCNTCKTRECENDEFTCEECAEGCTCEECEGDVAVEEASEEVVATEETAPAEVVEVEEEVVEEVAAPAEEAVEEVATPVEAVEEAAPVVEQPAPAPAPQPAPAPVEPQQPVTAVSAVANAAYSVPSPTLTSANMKKLEVLRNLYISGAITKEEYTALVKEYLK
ncbi:MAG: SHOCT domain-containing protein [Clostridia bacterium]|nr:SHOCT domain-containing protein [Clostridia bacterium]